jgi:hypothetical protein
MNILDEHAQQANTSANTPTPVDRRRVWGSTSFSSARRSRERLVGYTPVGVVGGGWGLGAEGRVVHCGAAPALCTALALLLSAEGSFPSRR